MPSIGLKPDTSFLVRGFRPFLRPKKDGKMELKELLDYIKEKHNIEESRQMGQLFNYVKAVPSFNGKDDSASYKGVEF